MSFKVGDLVEVIDGPQFMNELCREFIGHVGRISREALRPGFWRVDELVLRNGTFAIFPDLHLRKIEPDEFQPAEPEFVSDLLKRLGRVSA